MNVLHSSTTPRAESATRGASAPREANALPAAGASHPMSALPESMRAVVLDGPGAPEALRVSELPLPLPRAGEALLRVEAFGINRSEQHFRTGLAASGSFPRVPGIEATGTIAALGDGVDFKVGRKAAGLIGGMGREFDGGYAEYVRVPASIVVPFESDLPWEVLGALPEMIQTAYGSLAVGVRPKPGDRLLVRGGTSSIGLALLALGRRMGLETIATTRSVDRLDLLREAGAAHALVDDGSIAEEVRDLTGGGVEGAVELVGAPTLRDTLRATRSGGTVCFTGMLSDEWILPDFYPMDWLPNGVRLTAYSGEAADLPADVLQGLLDDLASGAWTPPRTTVYTGLEAAAHAHRDMEEGRGVGKRVVRVVHSPSNGATVSDLVDRETAQAADAAEPGAHPQTADAAAEGARA